MNIAVLDVYGFQTCFGSAASAFENIELAYIHSALKENFSVTLRKCMVPSPSRSPGGGTWVFFGWVCAARDSKLAPRSKKNFP